jgi:hypothetical protein
MYALHIEHPITDFRTWRAAFDRFADKRRSDGVVHARVGRPVDDDHYLMIDLDFPTIGQANQFLDFLRSTVWAKPENAPGLAGVPMARILAVDYNEPA